MKSFKWSFSKVLAVTVLLLFIFWLISPKIIAWVIKNQLPDGWHLDKIIVGYPHPGGVEIIDTQISTVDQQFKIYSLIFPFFSEKIIRIQQVDVQLYPGNNTNVNPAKITQPKPFNSDYSIELYSLNLQHPEFEFKGDALLTTKASQLTGTLKSHKNLLAVEANLLGMDGSENLKLSAKLGDKQFITIEYSWRETLHSQSVSFLGNIEQQLWQVLLNLKLAPLPKKLKVLEPQLAIAVQLQWQQWPNNLTQLLDANYNGNAQFDFSKLIFEDWSLNKNSLELNFNKNGELLLSSNDTFKIKRQEQEQEQEQEQDQDQDQDHQQPLQIEFNKLQQLPIHFKNSKITVSSPGLVRTDFMGHKISLEPLTLEYDLSTEILESRFVLNAELNPQSLSEFVTTENLTPIKFNTSGDIGLSNKKLTLNLQPSTLTVHSGIQLKNVQMNNIEATLIPIRKTFDLSKGFTLDSLLKINAKGNFNAEINTATLQLKHKCSWGKFKHNVKTQCETYPKKSKNENISSSFVFNTNKKNLSGIVSTEHISSKKWSLNDFAPEKISLDRFDASASLEFQLSDTNLIDLSVETLLHSITPSSYINIDNLNLSYEEIILNNAAVKMLFSDQEQLTVSLTASDLSLASDLKLSNIHGSMMPLQSANKNPETNLNLNFGIFEAKVHLTSSDFSFFKNNYNIQSNIQQLDMAKLLKWLDVEGLSGSGKMDGSIPITVHDKGFSIVNGTIHSTEDGVVRYQTSTTNDADLESNVAMDSLENFHYKTLSAKIESLNFFYRKQGNFHIQLRMIGKNPDSQFENEFAINPTLQGKIPAETWSHLITGKMNPVSRH